MALRNFLKAGSYLRIAHIDYYEPSRCNLNMTVQVFETDPAVDENAKVLMHTNITCYDTEAFPLFFSNEKIEANGANLMKACYEYLKTLDGFTDLEDA